jgi:hypothetical protein
VIVTSRDGLSGLVAREGARHLRLDVLTPGEAVDLLARVLGTERVAGEPSATRELAEMCGLLPLALRVAAANLVGQPGQSIAGYVARLRQGDRLAELAVDGDPQAAVHSAFDCSYATLSPVAQRLFRLLGLVPGPEFTPPATAALAGVPLMQAARLLGRLAATHLIEPHAPGRFGLHDLLRCYAARQAPPPGHGARPAGGHGTAVRLVPAFHRRRGETAVPGEAAAAASPGRDAPIGGHLR